MASEPIPAKRLTKHAELTEALRSLIVKMQPGERLPTQGELMRRYQVSDRTVLRSLDDLRRTGWIVRRQGSGTFVNDPALRRNDPAATQSMSSREGRTIACLTLGPRLERGTYFSYCADQLALLAAEAGVSLVCNLARSGSSFEDAYPLEAMRPYGFVLFGYYLHPVAEWLLKRGYRVVIVGVPPVNADPVVPCVYADHEHGGRLAARHLLDIGHRRIAFCFHSGAYSYRRTLRWQGHLSALKEAERAGESIRETVIDNEEVIAWRSDPALAARYFRRPNAPTAIAAWNDHRAITLLSILHRAGIRVPEDISLIGFDGLPAGDESIPALTTVNQHVDRQMHMVIELLSRPEMPKAQSRIVIPTLVSRSSTAIPTT